MRERDAFGTALQTLRQRLRDGAYVPGASLVIIDLAQEFGISPTPVREALARLIGEGLVEERKGWGLGVWRLDRAACEELYDLHRDQVEYALLRRQRPGHPWLAGVVERFDLGSPAGLRNATEAVFLALAEAGCHAWGIASHRRLADRLAPLRLAEAELFDDAPRELLTLATALDSGTTAKAQESLDRYHERRLAEISDLSRLASNKAGPKD